MGNDFCGEELDDFVPRNQILRIFSDSNKLKGAHLRYTCKDSRRWLGIVLTVGSANEPFVVCLLDGPGLVKIALRPE